MPVPLDSLFSFGFVTLLRLGRMVVVVTTLLPIASNGEGESVDLLGDGDNPTGPMVVVTTLLPIASNGDGESVELLGNGDNPTGEGDIATEDGVLTVSVELFKVQRLSAVREPALLSICVLSLQIVQLVHESEFITAENVSGGQLPHTRSVVTVPLVAII